MMVKVALVRSWYLPISETFIYSELVNLKIVTPIVCTKKLMNVKDFPFRGIHVFKDLNELTQILHTQKVNLIHTRFGTTGAEILQVKKRLNLPMLTSFHGFDVPSNRKIMLRYKGKLQQLFREGEAFTVPCNYIKEILLRHGCPEQKVFVHYSGIDIDKFVFQNRVLPKKGDIQILSVGRLVEKKGMDHLINAFHEVQKQYSNVHLSIAGDGPLQKKLTEQVRTLNLNDKITFLGAISHEQVSKEMQRSHLFALASVTGREGNQEGIPNVLKEAMATGLPVVSTRHAGIPELVRDGKSGFLVPEGDSQALAQRLLKLIRHPEKWAKMGQKGRKTITRSFNLEKQVLELEDLYAKILSGNV